jgi:hypothetical protein
MPEILGINSLMDSKPFVSTSNPQVPKTIFLKISFYEGKVTERTYP